jgi:hypothetical protein
MGYASTLCQSYQSPTALWSAGTSYGSTGGCESSKPSITSSGATRFGSHPRTARVVKVANPRKELRPRRGGRLIARDRGQAENRKESAPQGHWRSLSIMSSPPDFTCRLPIVGVALLVVKAVLPRLHGPPLSYRGILSRLPSAFPGRFPRGETRRPPGETRFPLRPDRFPLPPNDPATRESRLPPREIRLARGETCPARGETRRDRGETDRPPGEIGRVPRVGHPARRENRGEVGETRRRLRENRFPLGPGGRDLGATHRARGENRRGGPLEAGR